MEFSVWGSGFGLDFVWFWGVIGGLRGYWKRKSKLLGYRV